MAGAGSRGTGKGHSNGGGEREKERDMDGQEHGREDMEGNKGARNIVVVVVDVH